MRKRDCTLAQDAAMQRSGESNLVQGQYEGEFDNMHLMHVSALRENLPAARRVDVSVGYFNLRGWRLIDRHVEALPDDGGSCRLTVGMQRSPHREGWRGRRV
jgi:hypothetical protein